jgi:hypothetical protein
MTNKANLKKDSLIFLLLLFLLCTAGCDNTTDPQLEPDLKLELEDVSCTEAWITLTTNNLQLPATLNLIKDNNPIKTINLQTTDTLLYIDSLLPNQTYNFHSVIQSINHPSNEITVTTLDTTSHNFTWQTYTFGGEVGSNTFYDIAILDENSIWVVGDIKLRDSITNESILYNAAHWNGNQWTLHRIMFYTICGQQHQNAYPASSIIAFSENEIWIAQKGDQIAKIENGIQTQTICMPWTFSINKIWGTSSHNLYVVGNNGNISHFKNNQWNKIESGTTTNINDIFGVVDHITKEQIVFCAVSYVFQAGDQKILTIKNDVVDSLSWNVGRRIHSVWSKNGLFVYTAGGGIHENKRGYWNEITQVPLYYSQNIRGTDYNNIFVCGDFGLFSHFNGVEWKTFNELSIQGIYLSVAAKNNIVVAVGFEGNKAIIVKGIRN